MPRCSLWRPATALHPEFHAPGTCRSCWSKCSNTTDHSGHGCQDCLDAYTGHNDARVRGVLLRGSAGSIPGPALEQLADDDDETIAMTAGIILEYRAADIPDGVRQRESEPAHV